MADHHQPEIANAQKEFAEYSKWLQSAKWGASSVDIYISGMIVRATETMESMFHNAAWAPDNTLAILSRNLFETVVRMRYLAQDPEKRIHEFHFDDVRGRLGILGEVDCTDDNAERIAERTKLIAMRDTHRKKVKEVFNVARPPKLSVIRMCEVIGESDDYVIYRILSQYEHAMGMGIAGSVIDATTKTVVCGQPMEREQTQLIWQHVQSQMGRIRQAVDMLNSHRPS